VTQGFESRAFARRILTFLVGFLGMVVEFKCILKWLVGLNRFVFRGNHKRTSWLLYKLDMVAGGAMHRRVQAVQMGGGKSVAGLDVKGYGADVVETESESGETGHDHAHDTMVRNNTPYFSTEYWWAT
jgi:hypothetical protein